MNHYIKLLFTELSRRESETTHLTGEDLLEQLWHCYL